MALEPDDLQQLSHAKQLLESPGLAIKLANLVGRPLELGMAHLPVRWSQAVSRATAAALETALDMVLSTLGDTGRSQASNWTHKLLATASGAVGGAFGISALIVELPVSTAIMLRSIIDIARSEGEAIRGIESRLECLNVFALGGRSGSESAAETGYFAVRLALSRAVAEAAEFIAQRGVVAEGAPALVRLMTAIGARFEMVVTEKTAASAVPIIGALGGGLLNAVFISHFQDTARGHFIIRRMERFHGCDAVREVWDRL